MTDIFSPIDLLGHTLPNRIFMSAMTRTRAGKDGVPGDLMRDYFVQRASAGLIVTDCTEVSEQAHGVVGGPGIHTDAQIAGWREVTDAVHTAGGRIVCQLWHCGRVSHPEIRDGALPVGPSPIAGEGGFHLPRGHVELPVPRELATDEMPGIVESFAAATRNARGAGFDGVELHGANGYLHDQFLQDNSNHRADRYGGSVANRARLMVETAEAMIAAWDADHVGVRLSPAIPIYGTGPLPADDPARTLTVTIPDDPRATHLSVVGDTYTILVSGKDTNGRYCLIDMLVPDGNGPPPHRHDFEEMFTLLDGELEFAFRGETRTVSAPATVNIPANAPHAFRNRSGRTVHMLCMCTPAGQDAFFTAVGVPMDSRDAPPPELSEEEQAAKGKLAQELSPIYRTEMLDHA